MDFLHNALHFLVETAILVFEFIGTFVLIVNVFNALIKYLRKGEQVGLYLAKGLAMGLEFLLAGEILRTVVIGEVSELLIVGGIIILRIALTFIIHWEIHNEMHSDDEMKNLQHEKKVK